MTPLGIPVRIRSILKVKNVKRWRHIRNTSWAQHAGPLRRPRIRPAASTTNGRLGKSPTPIRSQHRQQPVLRQPAVHTVCPPESRHATSPAKRAPRSAVSRERRAASQWRSPVPKSAPPWGQLPAQSAHSLADWPAQSSRDWSAAPPVVRRVRRWALPSTTRSSTTTAALTATTPSASGRTDHGPGLLIRRRFLLALLFVLRRNCDNLSDSAVRNMYFGSEFEWRQRDVCRQHGTELVFVLSLGSHFKSQQRGICRQHGTELVPVPLA